MCPFVCTHQCLSSYVPFKPGTNSQSQAHTQKHKCTFQTRYKQSNSGTHAKAQIVRQKNRHSAKVALSSITRLTQAQSQANRTCQTKTYRHTKANIARYKARHLVKQTHQAIVSCVLVSLAIIAVFTLLFCLNVCACFSIWLLD